MLGLIPRAAINGVLIYVGMEGILSTSLWSRVCLLISPRASFPQRLAALGVPRVHLFTLLQLGLLGGCWLINLSPLGLCVAHLSPEPSPYPDPHPSPYPDPDPDPDPYPAPAPAPEPTHEPVRSRPRRRCVAFLIVALVPLRIMFLPRIFTDAELRALDSD